MFIKPSATELNQVNDFLAGAKSLQGGPPEWTDSTRIGDKEAKWPIEDDIGIVRAHLRFRFRFPEYPSMSLIFRGQPIWRVDVAQPDECKPNPHDAGKFNLPPRVCGVHEHAWYDNVDAVRNSGWGGLPYRRPINVQVRKLPQVLADFCGRVNLTLSHDQRSFDVPAQRTMRLEQKP
ncbi:hypothetical protein NLY43_23900 [Mesorhizobium sp. C416B]|uniref:hypothetical protein n=1 Tax=unclassified Mesorhizobium TaxID=325217 RepID=UPI0003CDDA7A|nr:MULTISPECIES: hypothetical protein [unclassified Mesorhizobium]ESX55706.1 hypothetical protein X761_14285 [Mesorhizobium sp. LSHC424B00]WJI61631.1 hypothetical protein NLY43_23900 [Mesorhizobium sp. C416B]